MREKTIRILDREVTRRDALKAGGIAGVGLAFSKPLMTALRPNPAFGQVSYGPCASDTTPPTISEPSQSSSVFTCTFQDTEIGLQSIDVTVLENMTAEIDPFVECTNDPVTVTVTHLNTNAFAEVTLVATDCCGNVSSKNIQTD